jgi:hypothetical protein
MGTKSKQANKAAAHYAMHRDYNHVSPPRTSRSRSRDRYRSSPPRIRNTRSRSRSRDRSPPPLPITTHTSTVIIHDSRRPRRSNRPSRSRSPHQVEAASASASAAAAFSASSAASVARTFHTPDTTHQVESIARLENQLATALIRMGDMEKAAAAQKKSADNRIMTLERQVGMTTHMLESKIADLEAQLAMNREVTAVHRQQQQDATYALVENRCMQQQQKFEHILIAVETLMQESHRRALAGCTSEVSKLGEVVFAVAKHTRKVEEKQRSAMIRGTHTEAVLREFLKCTKAATFQNKVSAAMSMMPELQERMSRDSVPLFTAMSSSLRTNFHLDVINEKENMVQSKYFPSIINKKRSTATAAAAPPQPHASAAVNAALTAAADQMFGSVVLYQVPDASASASSPPHDEPPSNDAQFCPAKYSPTHRPVPSFQYAASAASAAASQPMPL